MGHVVSGLLQEWARLLDLPRSDRDVLGTLAAAADDDGTSCFPSVDRIRAYCELSERQVQRILHERLEERAVIERCTTGNGGRLEGRERGATTVWRLCLWRVPLRSNLPDSIRSEWSERIKSYAIAQIAKGDIMDVTLIEAAGQSRVTFSGFKGDTQMSPNPVNPPTTLFSSLERVVGGLGDTQMSPLNVEPEMAPPSAIGLTAGGDSFDSAELELSETTMTETHDVTPSRHAAVAVAIVKGDIWVSLVKPTNGAQPNTRCRVQTGG